MHGSAAPANVSEGWLLGMKPADQPVRVLIRVPLPRMVGRGDTHVPDGVPRHLFVAGRTPLRLLSVPRRRARVGHV